MCPVVDLTDVGADMSLTGRNQRTSHPAPVIWSMRSWLILRAPTASNSTRTLQPRPAAAASRSANRSAMSPVQYTKVTRSTVRSAASIAPSIAGKISTPLRNTSISLPSVAGVPSNDSSRNRQFRASSSRDASMGGILP
jgi:hypothetical protein